MKSLTIAQVCADRGIAAGATKGASQHLRGIAAGLVGAGHRVVTYTARAPEGPFPVPVRDLTELTGCAGSNVPALDIVYERYSLGHRGGLDLARACGAAFVLEVNAPLVAEALKYRPETVADHHQMIEQELLGGADLVITVSTALTRWVDESRRGPTVTIPNGFEPEWFPEQASATDEPTLAFIGHPKPWHGADRLPEVLAALADRGHHPRLLLIGGGPGADAVMERAHHHGVTSQITITGALAPEHASALLSTASIGVAPYPRQEPFYFCPLKVLDYLAAGLPVVSTDQGDIADLVGEAGIVVAADDDRELVDAIASLLDDPGAARRLGAEGRRRAHATRTWAHAAQETATALQTLEPAVVDA